MKSKAFTDVASSNDCTTKSTPSSLRYVREKKRERLCISLNSNHSKLRSAGEEELVTVHGLSEETINDCFNCLTDLQNNERCECDNYLAYAMAVEGWSLMQYSDRLSKIYPREFLEQFKGKDGWKMNYQ